MKLVTTLTQIVRQRSGWDVAGIVLSVGLVAVACFVLSRLLRDVDVAKIIATLRATPPDMVLLAALLIATSYLALTFYDFFALRTIGHTHIPYRVAAFAGVVSYTIGHNIGATVFTAGLVRFRMYKGWGLTLIDIGKMAFITGLTFWLGNAVVLGVGLAYAPETAGAINQLPSGLNRALALAALAIIAGYLVWLMPRRRAIGRNGWKVPLPGASSTLVQIGIGIADLTLSALAMYVLISAHTAVAFVPTMIAFVLGALLGFASHAPGSLGVFEAAMLLALPNVEKEQLLASLLIFRCLYFLLPFILAVTAFGIRELWISAAWR